MSDMQYTLGIDIGSTTVKIAILDDRHQILFSDYQRHFANIRETLKGLLSQAYEKLGDLAVHPMITGSGGLTLANHLEIPFAGGDRRIHLPADLRARHGRGHRAWRRGRQDHLF